MGNFKFLQFKDGSGVGLDKEGSMKIQAIIATTLIAGIASAATYPIVDTGQVHTYDARNAIEFPKDGKPYYG